ncbi:hypothetical protein DXT99_12865 [Pontibacter diazotrophicus]|uniref:Uncharacterized protein n=1 Tax=Pontibacter diazotrophicus TaxID=1400979 RepID=A0A3D8LBR2_9BACT|nr:hypothetical protein [Pontibacter diazotrophicus]RDV14848.1 hypothetical protein DXT99_12865 [Pontibacter diazotrophicus]
MEDYHIILYALAAVIYFIFQQWRKAFNSPSDDADVEVPPQERRPQQPNRPPTSFEDILRELQPKVERAEERGKSIVENAKEQAKQVAGPVAPPAAEAPPKYRNYDMEVPKVMSWERKAAERQAARQSEEIRERLFKAEQQVVKPSKYAKLLKNPATVRDAFVLTEIFKRKYD